MLKARFLFLDLVLLRWLVLKIEEARASKYPQDVSSVRLILSIVVRFRMHNKKFRQDARNLEIQARCNRHFLVSSVATLAQGFWLRIIVFLIAGGKTPAR